MILTVASTKGGVGKSTLACNLSIEFSKRGETLLIDADAQASAALFTAAREAERESAGYDCVRACDLEVRSQIRGMRDKFDHIVVDVAGRDSKSLRAALSVSELVVIPVPPRSFDAWSLDQTAALVEDARCVNPDFEALAVLNLAFPRGCDNTEALSLLEDYPFRVAPTPLCQRKAWSDAAGMGMGILEVPRNTKAAAEFDALLEELEQWL